MELKININDITEENRFEKIAKFSEIERIVKGIRNNLISQRVLVHGKYGDYYQNKMINPNKDGKKFLKQKKADVSEIARKLNIEQFKFFLENYKSTYTKDDLKRINEMKKDCKPFRGKERSKITGKLYRGVFYKHPVRQYKDALPNEILLATILASHGLRVYLTKEVRNPPNGTRQFDALVNDIPVDFKTIGAESKNGVRNGFDDAMKKDGCLGVVIRKPNPLKQSDFGENASQQKKMSHEGILAVYIESEDMFNVFDVKNKAPVLGAYNKGQGFSAKVSSSNIIPQSVKKSIGNPRTFNNIKFNINYSTNAEALRKIDKALRLASFSLDVPLKSSNGEGFNFKAQEDLTDKWCGIFSKIVRGTYDFVINYFGLPEITIMSKAGELTWKGKILYSPENGEPIKKSEWDSFVKALEKFLNRNIANAADKIVLDSTALGKILDRMVKTNSLDAVKKLRLESLSVGGKSFDWISESIRNMKNTSGDFLKRNDYARIQIMQDSAAEKIKQVSDAMKSNIKQILIDGALERKSKTQVSQMIFDKMIGHNRDFQRIADTEIQRASTNAFVKEEVYKAEEGEKVYFQRIEVIDDNTCEYCKKINGRIAVWSDTPLSSGAVKDKYAELAIWEGKEWNGKKLTNIADAPVSVCHPYCRGVWIRYYPELDGIKKAIGDLPTKQIINKNGKPQTVHYNPDKNKKGSAASISTNGNPLGVTSAQNLHHNNISFLDNLQEKNDVKGKISILKEKLNSSEFKPKEYLQELKTCFNANDMSMSCYAIQKIGGNYYKLRISEHEAVVRNKQGNKTINTSIVIQLNKKRGRRNKTTQITEYIYNPESLDREKQKDILNGIKGWIETGEFSGTQFDMKKSLAE